MVGAEVNPKRTILALWAAVLAVSVACGLAWAAEPGLVAKVNGRALTERDLAEVMKTILPPYYHETSDEKTAKYRGQATERLIEEELFYQGALALGMKPDQALIKKEKEQTMKRLGGRKKFQEALKQYELTEEQYVELLGRRMLIPRFVQEQIQQKSVIGDMEAMAYYEANKSDFKRPEARALHHILIKVDPAATPDEARQRQAKAQEVHKMLLGGADFEAVAWEHSEDSYRVYGGNLGGEKGGLVHQGTLDPEVEREAWKLGTGELSGVVRTIFGFHIIRVDEIRPPEQLKYEDVADKIKKSQGDRRRDEIRKRILDDLRSKATIEVYAK